MSGKFKIKEKSTEERNDEQKLLSYILAVCMLMSLTPTIAYASVEGDKVSFDNRTYTMRSAKSGIEIVEPTSRYMEIEGDYGHTGSYTVTLTVETQDDGGAHSNTVSGGESDTDRTDSTTQQADHNSNLWLWVIVLFGIGALAIGAVVFSKKNILNK